MAGADKNINKVSIRMYCMGTGDCFVLKFFTGSTETFTMMIDCGSCSGTAADFKPYINNLKDYVSDRGIDLLVVTHEHQDHVNGFQKCKDIFRDIKIEEAWFAWTEDPKDPDGLESDLLKKRNKMRMAFTDAMNDFKAHVADIEKDFEGDHNLGNLRVTNAAFLDGLTTLSDINLPASDEPAGKGSLAGMIAIKEKLAKDKVEPKYLNTGDIKKLPNAPGLIFYVLGPPSERDSIFKDGKEGTDVYKKYFSLGRSMMSAEAYQKNNLGEMKSNNLPFDNDYVLDYSSSMSVSPSSHNEYERETAELLDRYENSEKWRKIDYDWITGVGSLALRLDSHINNTSLALAIEIEKTGAVLLFPGDAEYGNWESWQLIKGWEMKGKNDKPLAEDLLSRTIFYKVGHHLSYNGTALEKGIRMMPMSGMAAMVSLDRKRIAQNWKSTMPNKLLLQDLINRCDGRVFIMNEDDIANPPSKKADPKKIKSFHVDPVHHLFKEFTLTL